MASSVMLRCLALVRTDVSEERSATIIRVTRIGELGTKLALTSVLTIATRRNIPEDAILLSHRRESLKFYVGIEVFTATNMRNGVFWTSRRHDATC
jgi:hypothetical protein